MKKLLAITLTLIMVATLSITAFAANGAFLSSPSNNPAPEILDFSTETEDCYAELVVTPYADRDSLSEEARAAIEEAYKQIANAKDYESLQKALKAIADELGIDLSELSISDLFYIGYIGCEDHITDGHKGFTVTLKCDNIADLVGVLLFYNGEWHQVQILSIDKEAGTVTIFLEHFGPVAFVTSKYVPPYTGDSSMAGLWVALAGVSAVALAVTTKKSKKNEA